MGRGAPGPGPRVDPGRFLLAVEASFGTEAAAGTEGCCWSLLYSSLWMDGNLEQNFSWNLWSPLMDNILHHFAAKERCFFVSGDAT